MMIPTEVFTIFTLTTIEINQRFQIRIRRLKKDITIKKTSKQRRIIIILITKTNCTSEILIFEYFTVSVVRVPVLMLVFIDLLILLKFNFQFHQLVHCSLVCAVYCLHAECHEQGMCNSFSGMQTQLNSKHIVISLISSLGNEKIGFYLTITNDE